MSPRTRPSHTTSSRIQGPLEGRERSRGAGVRGRADAPQAPAPGSERERAPLSSAARRIFLSHAPPTRRRPRSRVGQGVAQPPIITHALSSPRSGGDGRSAAIQALVGVGRGAATRVGAEGSSRRRFCVCDGGGRVGVSAAVGGAHAVRLPSRVTSGLEGAEVAVGLGACVAEGTGTRRATYGMHPSRTAFARFSARSGDVEFGRLSVVRPEGPGWSSMAGGGSAVTRVDPAGGITGGKKGMRNGKKKKKLFCLNPDPQK